MLLQCIFEKKREETDGSEVRMPVALAKVLGSAPSTQEVASNHLYKNHKHKKFDANNRSNGC